MEILKRFVDDDIWGDSTCQSLKKYEYANVYCVAFIHRIVQLVYHLPNSEYLI